MEPSVAENKSREMARGSATDTSFTPTSLSFSDDMVVMSIGCSKNVCVCCENENATMIEVVVVA
jgi:hypothetical protein